MKRRLKHGRFNRFLIYKRHAQNILEESVKLQKKRETVTVRERERERQGR